jgi:hypothetical protein
MNTFPYETVTETVKDLEAKEQDITEKSTESGQDFEHPEGGGAGVSMGCGASSQSNVLKEETAHAFTLNSEHAIDNSRGKFANATSGDGGKEWISSEPGVFQEGEVLETININSEVGVEKDAKVRASAYSEDCVANTKHMVDVACSTEETCCTSYFSPEASLKQDATIGSKESGRAPLTDANKDVVDEPKTLDEQITNLYDEIRCGAEIMSWDILSRNSAVLSNWLLALGIGQDSMKFINDSFKDLRSGNITLSSFKEALKKELEISRKLLWVAQTGLLRCIAESIPPAKEERDPLSGLRLLDKEQVLELVQAMQHQLAQCLVQSIAESPIADLMASADSQCNNSKFCVDPTLFKMK